MIESGRQRNIATAHELAPPFIHRSRPTAAPVSVGTFVAELIAAGSEPGQSWRRVLAEGLVIRLGRAPAGGWSVPWDNQISREHAELEWQQGRLRVHHIESARNPIFFRGRALRDFEAQPGEYFVIGSTSFRVSADDLTISFSPPVPREQHTFRPGDLRRTLFRHADHRLEVLSHLPELIAESTSEEMFSSRLVNLLLAGIPHAEAAALVRRDDAAQSPDAATEPAADEPAIEVVQWDRRRDAVGRFQPSQRLMLQSLDRRESVLHIWNERPETEPEFTISENLDWAFCTPVPGEACRGWALYVAGVFDLPRGSVAEPDVTAEDLKGDIRFAELVAELVGALKQVRRLESQRAGLRQFFSPTVLDAISADRSERELEPKEADVTVLFCDLRGFSKEAEHWRENLVGLLERVSEALGVMTRYILQYGGVIGDFQGDAAMGFWGWPLAEREGPLPACRAALDILAEFRRAAGQPGHPLADFQVGIGIAHGRAVAGKIGTADQVKVTVFGPVVNLASRLEGMTRPLRVPILLDEPTADYVRRLMPPSAGRCRRLARVRPFGLENALMVSELLPPVEHDAKLSDQHIADYEQAVEAVLARRWSEALDLLHKLPPKDRAKDFLTVFIAQHNYEPPPHWDGVISMPSK